VTRKAAAKPPAVKTIAAKTAPLKRAAAKEAAPPLLKKISASLDDSKAENIVTLDLRGRTSIADYMIVATGRSTTHVSAIADRVLRMCKEAGFATPRVEGMPHCDWVLVDASDVIVHIFRPDVRAFYNLEKMWGGDRPVDGSATHAGRAG
jgi:ribosome-associated protein